MVARAIVVGRPGLTTTRIDRRDRAAVGLLVGSTGSPGAPAPDQCSIALAALLAIALHR